MEHREMLQLSPTLCRGTSRMRISLKYKFAYFSIPKTASEATRIFLDPYSDVEVVTFPQVTEQSPFYSHMLPREARVEFGKRGWDFEDFFRFATVRNPWARCASLFMMTQRSKQFERIDFSSWLKNFDPLKIEGMRYKAKWFPHGALPMSTFLADENGRLLVNKVYRLEDQLGALVDDLKSHVGEGIKNSELNCVNASPVAYDLKKMYGKTERDIVNRIYEEDIEIFGYEFPG